MRKLLISVRDAKAETWSVPATVDNKACALRDFSTLVADGRTLIGQHPGDFDLFAVGSFNTVGGIVESLVTPEHIANGLDFKEEKK